MFILIDIREGSIFCNNRTLKGNMTWTLPWQNWQDTDLSSFSSSFSLDTIAQPLIVFHVPSADGVDELNWLSSSGSSSWILEWLALSATTPFSLFWISNSSCHFFADKMSLCNFLPILRPILCQTCSSISFSLSVSMTKMVAFSPKQTLNIHREY